MNRRRSLTLASLVPLSLLVFACSSKGKEGSAEPPAPSAATTNAPQKAAQGPARCAPRGAKRVERAAGAFDGSSAIELVRAGDRSLALVADHDERGLHVIDTEAMQEIAVTQLDGRPGHVRALDNGLIAVTLRDTSRVLLLEPTDDALAKPLEERCAADVAAEPWALAEEGDKLYVTSGFGGALTALGKADLTATRVVPLAREPRGILVVSSSQTAFITHAVGGVVSAVDLKDEAKAPETASLHAGRRIDKNGEFGSENRLASQGYALARVVGPRSDGTRDALRIFAPHTSVDPGAPANGSAPVGYGAGGAGPRTMAPLVSVIDPGTKKSITNHIAAVFDDALTQECLLPRSAVADEKGLFVACIDIDAVLELDPWIGDPMSGERRRFALPAGPSALAMSADGARLFVWSEFDRALSKIARESGEITSVALWRRAGEPRNAKIEHGERLFHTTRDARIGLSRGCASCHPEGRDDNLTWTSPDGLRQTPILAGRIDGTGPYGWFGEHATLRDHVINTFTRLGGTGLQGPFESDLEDLMAYVASIPPPPSVKPKEPDIAERGKQVFVAYGCNGCHKEGGTDGKAHDVGSGAAGERHPEFDTPALRAIRGSAPYYHDGRYPTLDAMLTAKDQKMFSGNLSGADKQALITYLETL